MNLLTDAKHIMSSLRGAVNTLPSRYSDQKRLDTVYRHAINHAMGILENRGAPRQFMTRYTPGADQSRLRNDWLTSIKSMTSLITSEWKTLVARSELAMRTNSYARSARNILLDHIVGSGLRPFPAVKDKSGNMLDVVNSKLASDWQRYNDECIRSGNNRMTQYESQRLALGTIIDTGAVLVNTVNSRKGDMLPNSFQILKPTRLDWSHDSFSNVNDERIEQAKVVHGIKLNTYGEATGYYIEGYVEPIPAEVMSLFFNQIECEQYMGLPWLTPVLPFIWDLDQLLQSRIVAARLVEDIALWIKNTSRKALGQSMDSEDDTVKWERGQVLSTKDKPELIESKENVAETFAPLVRLYLHGIGAGLGFSYVLLTRDLDRANFASTRFNKIADNKYFQSLYNTFRKGYPQHCWNNFVRQEFLTGRIGGGYSATQYQSNPWYYNQCFWLPEGEDWVDPLKDAQALVLAYKSGWLTLQDICALKGKDWKSILTQRKVEKDFLIKEGLQELLPAFEGAIEAQNSTDDDQDGEEATASNDRNLTAGGFDAF